MRWCEKKYKQRILKSTKKNDGVAYHHHSTAHKIDFENVDIITQKKELQEKTYTRRTRNKTTGKQKQG